MSNTIIHRIPPALVGDFWPLIESYVRSAIEYHKFMDAEDVHWLLDRGYCQLFVATDGGSILGFAIMEVIHYPRKKVANVFLSGGSAGFLGTAVNVMLPELQQWGREQSTDYFAIMGARPGWERALKGKDFSSMPHLTLWTDGNNVEGRRERRDSTNDEQ